MKVIRFRMGLSGRDRTAAHAALLSLMCVVIVRTAWISDDAEITLRCVMNFLNGYGPTFNIDERVQPYTHPLWFLLITGATLITHNVFAATFALSIALSILVLWLLIAKVATNFGAAMLAGAGLLLSKAYIDYCTSGLENPLSCFLLIAGLMLGFRCLEDKCRSPAACLTVLLLSYLSRPDLVLLVLPFGLLVLWTCYQGPFETVRILLIAIIPEIAWTILSLFYYGAPVPNTAYAKLTPGIPEAAMIWQGAHYFLESFARDPLTLTFIILGIMIGAFEVSSLKAIAAGIVFYLWYLLYIGGDFMSGRFFTIPLLASAVILARTELSTRDAVMVALVFAATGAVSIRATVLSDLSYNDPLLTQVGISDERGYCFPGRGLPTAGRDFFAQPNWPRGLSIGAFAVQCGNLGAGGISYGPAMHFIDPCALTDPFLSRLPPKDDPHWRIGHFVRQMPAGYEQSVITERNLLSDPLARNYLDLIRDVTRGPLFSLKRMADIARLNLGLVAKPDFETYRTGNVAPLVIDLASLSQSLVVGVQWYGPGTFAMEGPLEVLLPKPTSISSIDASFDHNDRYLVEYLSSGRYLRLGEFGPTENQGTGMVRYTLKLVQPTAPTDRLRITPTAGDLSLAVGHLILNQ